MTIKNYFLLTLTLIFVGNFYGQVGIGTTNPSPKAMLEVSSTSDAGATYQGFMPPRVASEVERDEINPTADDAGLMVYVLDSGCLQIWNGLAWKNIHCSTPTVVENASNLFISEYVEGSSNNKAIEIANFTGSPKNLNGYELAIYSNGSSTSQTPITFNSGFILNDGEVYVIKHSLSNIPGSANQTSGALGFNGDDVVALRTSTHVIIDILGEIGSSYKFGENRTLRKKEGFGPSILYNQMDYDSFPEDTFSGLGSHTY